MPSIGDLVATLVADTRQFKAGLSSAQSQLASFATKAASSLAGIAATFATIGFGKDVISAAESDVKATQKLEAILIATGGAAGVTSQEINKLAGDLQKVTKFEDDATVNAAALLATFKNIKGDQFKDVLKLAQDLAATKDIGLDEATLALGKALTQGADGATALKKAGVILSDSQITLLKNIENASGEIAAQEAMIRMLQNTFGGAAERTVTASEKIMNRWSDMKESFGKELLPAVELFADRVVPMFDNLAGAGDEAEESWFSANNALIRMLGTTGLILHGLKSVNEELKEIKHWGDGEKITVDLGGFLDDPDALHLFAEGEQELFPQDEADKFHEAMQRIKNDLDEVRGASKGEIARRQAIAAGMTPEHADAIKFQTDFLEAEKEVKQHQDEITQKADAIRESVKTDADRLQELKDLLKSGDIDQETFDKAKAKLGAGGRDDNGKAGALQKGSAEQVSAVLQAMRSKEDIPKKQLDAQEEAVVQLEDANGILREMQENGVAIFAGSIA